MDIIIVLILIWFILSLTQAKRLLETDKTMDYHKKSVSFSIKVLIIGMIVTILLGLGMVCILTTKLILGIILLILCILIIIWFVKRYKKDWKELRKAEKTMNAKEEDIYQTELIKERARLQARKELKKK